MKNAGVVFSISLFLSGCLSSVGNKGNGNYLIDNGDGTITDNKSGLMWVKNSASAGGNNGNPLNWDQAMSYCKGLNYAGYSDWRLPNQEALESIVDATREGPAINTLYFPDMKLRWYWTSTDDMFGNYQATFVGFNIPGEVKVVSKAAGLSVRCVRGEAILPPKKSILKDDDECEGVEDANE